MGYYAAESKKRKIMRGLLIVLMVVLVTLPARAQDPIRKWVKAGTDPEHRLDICVDQNSIVKRVDGLTEYLTQWCDGPDVTRMVVAVQCDQDMSGLTIQMKESFLKKDGSYKFGQTNSTKSTSMMGQSAKFVCKK